MPWHSINLKIFAIVGRFYKLSEAIKCSKGYFSFVKRKDGRDEFVHALRVTQIAIYYFVKFFYITHKIAKDIFEDFLIACLLHDVPENIDAKLLGEIIKSFGERVGLWVWLMSKPEKIGMEEISHLYFFRIAEDIFVIIIKFADRLHNLRNMTKNLGKSDFFSVERLLDQIFETQEKVEPLVVEAIRCAPEFTPLILAMYKDLLDALTNAKIKILENK